MITAKQLQPWRTTITRIGVSVCVVVLLRAISAQSARPDIHQPEVPRLLEILRVQRENPELFLKREIDEAFIRKTSGLVVWNNPNPPLEQLAQHLYVGNMMNFLDKGLDEYDSNVERVIIQKADQAPPDLVRALAMNAGPIAWARGSFVVNHLGSGREQVVRDLRASLKASEASQYGKYRSMGLAGVIALCSTDSSGLLGHLTAALNESGRPGMRIMAAETLGHMGLRAWPAVLALTRASFALDRDVSASARRAIIRLWLIPALPFALLQLLGQTLTPFGTAAIIAALLLLLVGYLDALRIREQPTYRDIAQELLPSQKGAKWLLFWGLTCSVPTLGFYIVAAGFVPAIWYLLGPLVGIMSGSWDGLGFMFIFNSIHFAVYGGVFYLAAYALSALIFRVESEFVRYSTLGSVLVVMLCAAAIPMFLPISHNSPGAPRNILGIFSSR